jgi:hypothetical protein
LALRVFGYGRTQRALMRSTAGREASLLAPSEQFRQARRVAYCVRVAARKGTYRATCLRESLVTCWLLRRSGIPAALTIGVGKDAADFRAHAWVELHGEPVIDEAHTLQDYASIHRAGGGAGAGRDRSF